MLIGYARVSTLEQTLALQQDALTKAGCERRPSACRLRRNATYQDRHDDLGGGLTTAGDDHQVMVAFLADALSASDETDLSALAAGRVCLIDGTFAPRSTGATAPIWPPASIAATGERRAAGRPARPAPRCQPGLSRELARRALLL